MKTNIDSDWFKEMHRKTGITQAETAAALGRAPTFLTRIYSGEQEMRLRDAKIISKLLQVPLAQVMIRAGLGKEADLEEIPEVVSGMAEPSTRYEVRQVENAEPASADASSNSVQSWRVETQSLASMGILQGDNLRIDLNAKPRTGDVVIAQIYDWRSGTAETVIRGYHHPYLVKSGTNASEMKPETVDNERIVIKGVVTMVWRERPGG